MKHVPVSEGDDGEKIWILIKSSSNIAFLGCRLLAESRPERSLRWMEDEFKNISNGQPSSQELVLYDSIDTTSLLPPTTPRTRRHTSRPQNLPPPTKTNTTSRPTARVLTIPTHIPILIDVPTLALAGPFVRVTRRSLRSLLVLLPLSLSLALALHFALEEGFGGPAAGFGLVL